MSRIDSLAIFGGGKIGEALVSGLLRGERTIDDLVVCERHADRAAYLSETYGVRSLSTVDAAAAAQVLLIAVKPQDIASLLEDLAPTSAPTI